MVLLTKLNKSGPTLSDLHVPVLMEPAWDWDAVHDALAAEMERRGMGHVEKGGPGSGHHGHKGTPGRGGSAPGVTASHIPGHVWERAGERTGFKVVRQAIKKLKTQAVLPDDEQQEWHMPLRRGGRVVGYLSGIDAVPRTVLGRWYEGRFSKESVEIIVKGGPGSGHHGHRGSPGRGGSLPRAGASIDIQGMGGSMFEMLLDDPKLLDSHKGRLNRVTNDSPPDYPDWVMSADKSPTGREIEVLGAYNRGMIHLNPANRLSVTTFYHELGHHVFLKSDWIHSDKGQRSAKLLSSKFGAAQEMGNKVYGLGLTRNSVLNAQEFGADCFKVYFKGRQPERQSLADFLGVADMDDVFGD